MEKRLQKSKIESQVNWNLFDSAFFVWDLLIYSFVYKFIWLFGKSSAGRPVGEFQNMLSVKCKALLKEVEEKCTFS